LRATTGLYAKGLNIKFAVDSLVSDVTAVEIDEDKPIDEENMSNMTRKGKTI